jgi:hypothetical protein
MLFWVVVEGERLRGPRKEIVMNASTAMVVVIALLVVGALVWTAMRQRRSTALRSQFGPEYDRVMHERGSKGKAESELAKRQDRISKLHIRALTPGERAHYAEEWRMEQAHFVDEPRDSVNRADRMVEEVMKLRGYPVADFEQRAADVSVDHPHLVDNYRRAHDIAVRNSRGQANTEDLRNAMISFRSLFEDLLEDRPVVAAVRRAV